MNSLLPPEQNSRFIEHPIAAAITSEIVGVNALTTYWRESIRGQRETEVFAFLQEVSHSIAELYKRQEANERTSASKIDLSHLDSDDFKRTLAKVCEVVVREGDESKRQYLMAFIVNYSKERRPDVTIKQLYLSLLDRLTGSHIVLLKALYDRQRDLSDGDLVALKHQPDRTEVVSITGLQGALSMDAALLELLKHTSETAGLIAVIESADKGEDRSQRLVLRPIGRSLIRFLIGDWD